MKVSVVLIVLLVIVRATHEATDSIKQGQQLRDWDILVSANGTFKLGFYIAGRDKFHYLVLWFNGEILDADPVWVANRDTPIPDSSGVLSIDRYGRLTISYGGGETRNMSTILISSNETNNDVVTATLLDTGNFILSGLNNETGERLVLWQSFDYPTDKLLPGMKLGINYKTGHRSSLTSSLSNKVPSSGAFVLGMDPNNTNQLMIWRRGDVYWKSGAWNGTDFNNSPTLTSRTGPIDLPYNLLQIQNKNEKYFTFSPKLASSLMVWRLNSEGDLRRLEKYHQDFSGGSLIGCHDEGYRTAGCVSQKQLACRDVNERFKLKKGSMVMKESKRDFNGSTIATIGLDGNSLSDCDALCKSDCSCVAYAIDGEDETNCNVWTNESKFKAELGEDGSLNNIYVSTLPRADKWWTKLIISATLSLVILLVTILSYRSWKVSQIRGNLKSSDSSEGKLLLELDTSTFHDESMLKNCGKKGHGLILFSFKRIAIATDNFSSENKLGQGGFGPVYKGKLWEGVDIAVKKLSKSSGQGFEEFKNEIVLIAKLQHTNLVRLLGCCIQDEEKMLIYEYMPNKSLDFYLFDPYGRELLDWRKRFIIIEGIAQGVLYLHKYSRLRVIHRDLKASNILLDNKMNAKISDFGMARIFGLDESEANTKRIVGTYGYMSPEYAMEGNFSVKSDVFSFGVLLLEIVSGRKNNSFNYIDHPLHLINHAWELWVHNKSLELVDPMLDASCFKDELLRSIHVGLLCVQECAADRPIMSDVVSMLTNENTTLPNPKKIAFYIQRKLPEVNMHESKPRHGSTNGVTISDLEAR